MPQTDAPPQILLIKITLLDVSPPVWRRLWAPADMTLARLHECIQYAMGWEFAHLHEFRVGERRYGVPDPEFADPEHPVYRDTSLKLSAVVKRGISSFVYVYDFGDYWRHEVTIEQVAPAEPGTEYPCFVDGARRAPPEDCGGAPGFEEFLEAVTDRRHPEHKRMSQWCGGSFDPEDIGLREIQIGLARMADARRRAIAGHAKRRSGNDNNRP